MQGEISQYSALPHGKTRVLIAVGRERFDSLGSRFDLQPPFSVETKSTALEGCLVRFWSQLGERELDLEVRVTRGHLDVETEGRRLSADYVPLPDGEVYSLLIDGRVHEVAVEEEGQAIFVTLHGQRHRVLVRHPLEKTLREVRHAAPASGLEIVESPIPGLVVALKVKPGDRVLAGQAVAVVEAMKMQNELVSERGGVVEAVHVEERRTVVPGQKLVTLRPPASKETVSP